MNIVWLFLVFLLQLKPAFPAKLNRNVIHNVDDSLRDSECNVLANLLCKQESWEANLRLDFCLSLYQSNFGLIYNQKIAQDSSLNITLFGQKRIDNIKYMIWDADYNISTNFPCKTKVWETNFCSQACLNLYVHKRSRIYIKSQTIIMASLPNDKRRSTEVNQAIYIHGQELYVFLTFCRDNARAYELQMVKNDETKLCFWLSIADIQHFVFLVHSPSFVHGKSKRCNGRCQYYPNSIATRQILLKGGDIEQNPGPHRDTNSINSIISSRCSNSSIPSPQPTRNLSNLIKVKTSGISLAKSLRGISMCSLNARSLRNKSAAFVDLVCDVKADIFTICETWLTVNDSAVLSELRPPGYKTLCHCPRTNRIGGGTALLIRDGIDVVKVLSAEKSSFEVSEWLANVGVMRFRVVVMYRPPYSAEHPVSTAVFIGEFAD